MNATIPPLRLDQVKHSDPQHILPLSALPNTAPHLGRDEDHGIVQCPKCRHRRGVVNFHYWIEQKEMVYHCTYSSRVRHFPGICGYKWKASRPMAICDACCNLLQIEFHYGHIGYACAKCMRFDTCTKVVKLMKHDPKLSESK
jgi:hypothetical protein